MSPTHPRAGLPRRLAPLAVLAAALLGPLVSPAHAVPAPASAGVVLDPGFSDIGATASSGDRARFKQAAAAATTWSIPSVPGPPQVSGVDAGDHLRDHPGTAPRGVNVPGCRPGPEHPRPVVLVHGTDSALYKDYAALGPMLADAGWCVYGLDYGRGPLPGDGNAWGDLTESARQLDTFVTGVLAETGAAQVDVVGFSQGANVSRWWVNKLAAGRAHRWVGLASPTRGGTFYGLGTAALERTETPDDLLRLVSPSLVQQIEGAPWLAELNSPAETVPGVEYSTVSTRYDEMIQPFENMAIRDDRARNLVVQDFCPGDGGGHMALPYDPTAQDLVIAELAENPTSTPRCEPLPLGHDMIRTFAEALTGAG